MTAHAGSAQLVLLLCVVAAAIAAAPRADRPDADAKALRGLWEQSNGDRSWRWEFTDDGALVEYTGARRVVTGRSPVRLDASKSPKHISWDQGVGVYELKGDVLTVCLTPNTTDEKDRPKRLDDEKGKYQLLVFKRAR